MGQDLSSRARRLPDWPARLAAFIAERRSRPFAWGVNDCCALAWEAAEALTGRPTLPVVPPRVGRISATRVIVRLGGRTVFDLARQAWGDPIDPLLAQRGDIVGAALGGWSHNDPTLGVCVGSSFALAGPDCLVFAPLTVARCAWRVG